MDRILARRLGALALAGAFAAPAAAADPAPAAAEPKPLLARLNPFAQSPPPAAPAKPVGPRVSAAPPAVAPLSAETMKAVLQGEQDAYLRRLDICTQLRRVAFDRKDEALLAQADELEKLAEITYKTRIARMGMKPQLRNAPPADDLERSLGAGMTARPTAGVRTPAEAAPATAQLKNNFREVKP